ncbi:HAD-IIA family hydrolase [Streptomyces sp. NPDC051776]|uniref:HAD-IIA family hydrolase n=1 Tax=Streptomyces sp. NPDC051776 TaxID=3155414 RepID=UPI00342AB2FA
MNDTCAPGTAPRPAARRYAGYALDLDGTVYLGDELLPGADETIAQLRRDGARVVFVTNKPLESAAEYAEKLTRLGVPATADDVVTALDALVLYLRERHPGARLLTVAEPLAESVLTEAGFTVVGAPAEADVVVVSFDRTFDYAKLHGAYTAVRGGAVIVATNADPYCPTADGGLPDCAAMTAAIEACTEVRAEAVVGKPSRHMARACLGRLGVPAREAAMVGDRLATDVAMARTAGMAGVLVLTGATSAADLAASGIRPQTVVSSLKDLL